MLSRVLAKSSVRRVVVASKAVRHLTSSSKSANPYLRSESPYKNGKFRSNAQELINNVPVIEVAEHVAVCDGGSGALGHPLEYIQLDTVSNSPQNCKYCGLRYKMKHGAHHH
jgi:NADH dehydrogenase (ubiquinone) Fe-S protein 6